MIKTLRWMMFWTVLASMNAVLVTTNTGWWVLIHFLLTISCCCFAMNTISEISQCFQLIKDAVVYAHQVGQPMPELANLIAGDDCVAAWKSEADVALEDAKQLVARSSLKP